MLEDEGFPGAECWRMKVLKGRVLEDEGSQGQGAGG